MEKKNMFHSIHVSKVIWRSIFFSFSQSYLSCFYRFGSIATPLSYISQRLLNENDIVQVIYLGLPYTNKVLLGY